MIQKNLSFPLPEPWQSTTFETDSIGVINFLVGPNGSGKSRFAEQLLNVLTSGHGPSRVLSTDRLSALATPHAFRYNYGDPLASGYPKDSFTVYRDAGRTGSGIDTIILLQERPELRILLEATLSSLFDRLITLEWDSGNLIPTARLGAAGSPYRLDRDECHGLRELLVLLTHLYDTTTDYLIIDEPELNLHPQYQAFFMSEMRKVAGDPSTDPEKKVVFLITHSPFILDLRELDDLRAVISFDLSYRSPKQVGDELSLHKNTSWFLSRLDAENKQFFFSDHPVFVEGDSDANIFATILERCGSSIAGAGSCIISSDGSDEVNWYSELCRILHKDAYFIYDLDSLFHGRLRNAIDADPSIPGRLAAAGLGSDFRGYCRDLDKVLLEAVDRVLAGSDSEDLHALTEHLSGLGERKSWTRESTAKARTALLVATHRWREAVVAAIGEEQVADIEGRLNAILSLLEEKNIFVLPGGSLENHLPQHTGDTYDPDDSSKKATVRQALEELSRTKDREHIANEYPDLYRIAMHLPARPEVDIEPVVKRHLGEYIYALQNASVDRPYRNLQEIADLLNARVPELCDIFSLETFQQTGEAGFTATVRVKDMPNFRERRVEVTDETNAGMLRFDLA